MLIAFTSHQYDPDLIPSVDAINSQIPFLQSGSFFQCFQVETTEIPINFIVIFSHPLLISGSSSTASRLNWNFKLLLGRLCFDFNNKGNYTLNITPIECFFFTE